MRTMFLGFQWLPKKWGKRKISEEFFQSKFELEGKGITITTYSVYLYIVSIPLRVKKYNTL
ncbi:hypothetical protein [Bacillus bingmayongensis]|uniref:hypothetical protein n=1 Tax=Bacillus bingmayongensis TaxID=1150157 RepID=UPI001C8D762E|nr:hypothetical protein [Bacillus bingmayongensis]MBY0599421.1 hypothetical protein [Bacillus bingmayongensis]